MGLELVLRGLHQQRRFKPLLAQHYYPDLALDLGAWLARRIHVSAMMDISDGLSIDLHRLCRSSGVGARIHATQIPCVAVPAELSKLRLDPLLLALDGGEDYSLLFTVPRSRKARIPASFRGAKLTCIGEIVRGTGVKLVTADGRSKPLEPRGWDHFRPPASQRKRKGQGISR
jgi:thiamine-monophosphate kinase